MCFMLQMFYFLWLFAIILSYNAHVMYIVACYFSQVFMFVTVWLFLDCFFPWKEIYYVYICNPYYGLQNRHTVLTFSLCFPSCSSSTVLQNDEQMSMSSPVDSQFFRMLLEEEGNNMRELLDAEEYLVPQPNHFPRTQGDGASRHQSYRVISS